MSKLAIIMAQNEVDEITALKNQLEKSRRRVKSIMIFI
jgi:hypothetical protein